MSIRIITDSGSDISQEEAKKYNITVLPLKTFFGEQEYIDGVTMSHSEFYEKLIETDLMPTTSQVSPFEYESVFQEIEGTEDVIICITLSSKLSGCFQSAQIAAEDYKDKIFLVDSENACVGERILVEYAIKLREQGLSAEAIYSELQEKKKKIQLVALLDTLEYLKKGGRISPLVATAGNLLSIKPVITVVEGEVALVGKARGSKAGNNKLSEVIESCGGINFDMPYFLAYSGLSDTMIKKYISDFDYMYKEHVDDLPIGTVGCVIGTHVGPGAIAVAFFSK